MNELKVGMKVRVVEHENLHRWQMKHLGQIGIVVDDCSDPISVRFDDGEIMLFFVEKLEEVKGFTKADFKDGMFVCYKYPTCSKDKKRVVIDNKIYTVNATGCISLNEFNADLTHKYNRNYDIAKVYDRGKLIWEREEVDSVGFDEMEEGCLYKIVDTIYTGTYTRVKNELIDLLLCKGEHDDWRISGFNTSCELETFRFLKVVE